MLCCGKGMVLAEFFEKGFGKFLLILVFLLIAFYIAYFTISTCSPKMYLTSQFIELKQDQDFLMGKNEAGYGGYIRFETKALQYPGSKLDQISIAKIVLQFQKDSQYRHAVKIELFDKVHRLISEILLQKESFRHLVSGYSYNVSLLKLPRPYTINDVAYFRYSFIEK